MMKGRSEIANIAQSEEKIIIHGKIVTVHNPFSLSDSPLLRNQSQPMTVHLELEALGELGR
jgi:hypothetical protein